MIAYGVGLGGCGARVQEILADAVERLARLHPSHRILGRSRRYLNPAWGGVTRAPFVNMAVVVTSTLTPPSLLGALHTLEWHHGRVRAQKNSARTLDVDLLWWNGEGGGPTTKAMPSFGALMLPHPRLAERSFAVVPLLEAMRAARVPVPLHLVAASAQQALAPLTPTI